MTPFYDETRAILTIYSGSKAYRYKDVPLSVANAVKRLWKRGHEGKVWQLVKTYEEDK